MSKQDILTTYCTSANPLFRSHPKSLLFRTPCSTRATQKPPFLQARGPQRCCHSKGPGTIHGGEIKGIVQKFSVTLLYLTQFPTGTPMSDLCMSKKCIQKPYAVLPTLSMTAQVATAAEKKGQNSSHPVGQGHQLSSRSRRRVLVVSRQRVDGAQPLVRISKMAGPPVARKQMQPVILCANHVRILDLHARMPALSSGNSPSPCSSKRYQQAIQKAGWTVLSMKDRTAY